ncbi:hypothetical protein [Streptomyces flaveolus]|uniref:hypothetical protein n=1 Tax=Streptomyces flaveolus TaxID=67297 RepID=UPI003695CD0C
MKGQRDRKRGLAVAVLGLVTGAVVLAATALLDRATERCGNRLEIALMDQSFRDAVLIHDALAGIVNTFNHHGDQVFRTRELPELLHTPTDEASVNITRSRLGRLTRQGFLTPPGRGRLPEGGLTSARNPRVHAVPALLR